MFKYFTILVPVGHTLTPSELLAGINRQYEGKATGELHIHVMTYKDLLAVKDARIPGSMVIVNQETFSCGNYYTDEDEYNEMVNRVLYGIRGSIVCVSKLHAKPSIQRETLKNACVMRVKPGQECRIINKNLEVWLYHGTLSAADLDPKVASYAGKMTVAFTRCTKK